MMRLALVIAFLGLLRPGHAQWTDLASGIDDDLTGVYWWDTHVVICGERGIYFSTTAGIGTDAWTRFGITGSPSDEALYDRTSFSGVTAREAEQDVAYFAGTDTVEQRAIILRVNISDQSYGFLYIGATPSALNAISVNTAENRIHAVGDHGLVLRSTDLTSFTEVASGLDMSLLSLNSFSSTFLIGGEGVYVFCSDQTSGLTLTPHLSPGRTFRGIRAQSSTQHYGVGEAVYRFTSSASPTDLTSFEPFPLDGRDIMISGSSCWVATGHGMYKGGSNPGVLEWQPSAGNGAIDDIQIGFGSAEGYAVGENGLVLYTDDGGGSSVPFCGILSQGGCVGESTTVSGSSSWSDNTCAWQLDGEPFTGSCSGNFPLVIDEVGVHELTFSVSNGVHSDTAHLQIHIVDPPLVDLAVTVSDSILCKQGTTTITLAGSQADVTYTCRDITHEVDLANATGNGGMLQLNTSVIDGTADLVIEARNIYAACTRTLSDTIHIRVEETLARLHGDLVNALVGEGVGFYAHCDDAQHFDWDFGPSAQTPGSGLQDPEGISYLSPGPTDVTLICWSDAGCYDTLTSEGPFIFEEGAPDSCWTMMMVGNDPLWDGYGRACITDGHDTGDGFLVSGKSVENVLLPSRQGRTALVASESSGFLAKYTYSGVLRWWVETLGEPVSTIAAISSQSNGNILISGTEVVNRFLDNAGDTLPYFEYGNGYLLCLDARGRHQWHSCFSLASTAVIDVDSLDNIYVMGSLTGIARYWHEDVEYSFNTVAVEEGTFLMRTSPSGAPVWQTYIESEYTNPVKCWDMDVDAGGTISLGGDMEYGATFHSANGGPSYLAQPTELDYGGHMYAARYDANGQFLWCLYAIDNTYGSQVVAVATAENGDLFITGNNDLYATTQVRELHHSDGSVTEMTGYCEYFVAKLDAGGHLVWGNGPLFSCQSWTTGLDLTGDRVTSVSQFGYGGANGYMSSIGTTPLWCAASGGDLFMTVYDLDGALQHVYVPWTTLPNAYGNITDYRTPIFRDPVGTIMLLGEIRTTYGVSYWGDSLFTAEDDLWDGFISKPGLNCAQIPMPVDDPLENGPSSLSAYPNPFTGDLWLKLPHKDTWRITVLDALGRPACQPMVTEGREVKLPALLFNNASGPLVVVAASDTERHGARVVRVME